MSSIHLTPYIAIRILLIVCPVLYFIALRLFCDCQFVLLNPFPFFTQCLQPPDHQFVLCFYDSVCVLIISLLNGVVPSLAVVRSRECTPRTAALQAIANECFLTTSLSGIIVMQVRGSCTCFPCISIWCNIQYVYLWLSVTTLGLLNTGSSGRYVMQGFAFPWY